MYKLKNHLPYNILQLPIERTERNAQKNPNPRFGQITQLNNSEYKTLKLLLGLLCS